MSKKQIYNELNTVWQELEVQQQRLDKLLQTPVWEDEFKAEMNDTIKASEELSTVSKSLFNISMEILNK